MLAAYFVIYGLLLVSAFYIKSAFSSAVVLTASWAASFLSGVVGLGILAPYIDGLAFYGLLVCALKDPTKENIRCVWLGVVLVAVHAAFNGAGVFVTDWDMANRLATGYMITINCVCLLQAWVLGGRNVKRLCGLAYAGWRDLFRHPAGRRYAREALPEKDAAG